MLKRMALSNSLRSLRQTLWTMLKKPTSSVAVTHRCVRQSAKKSISSQNLQRSQHCAVQPIQLHKRLYSEERNTSETDGVSSLNLESRGTKHSNTTKSKLPHPGHLDYDLDKLLQNIRKAQQSGELAQETAEDRDGRMSAMSIEELVKFLEEEKGEEVCVIRVPPEREYVKYFVTCVGVGGRHLQRMADNLAAEVRKSVCVFVQSNIFILYLILWCAFCFKMVPLSLVLKLYDHLNSSIYQPN